MPTRKAHNAGLPNIIVTIGIVKIKDGGRASVVAAASYGAKLVNQTVDLKRYLLNVL